MATPYPAASGRGGQIEIKSWSWGTTNSGVAKVDGFAVKQGVKPGKDGAKGGNVEFEWKVEEGESAPPASGDMTLKGSKIGQNARESGEKGGTEDINIGVGELQEAPPRGGVRVAAGDVDGDGRAAGKKPTTSRSTLVPGATKPTRASTGASETIAVGGGRTEARRLPPELPVMASLTKSNSGAPAEKRQHGWNSVSRPLDRGSVRVKVKFPWVGCAVGARYPVITLGDGAKNYQLRDVTVASCGRSAGPGDEGPEESITFVYGKLGATWRFAQAPDDPHQLGMLFAQCLNRRHVSAFPGNIRELTV